MRDFARFRSADLAGIVELLGELQEIAPNRQARAEHLVRGLARLIGAQVGIYSELHQYLPGRPPHIVPLFDFGWLGPTERAWNMSFFEGEQLDDPLTNRIIGAHGPVVTHGRGELVSDADWYHSPNVMELRRKARIDHCLYSNFFVAPGEGMSLAFHRPWGDEPFGEREIALVDVVHARQRIYELPSTQQLSPRQQQVLEALLAGDSEKQVASKMGISFDTVHTHIKSIYKKMNVCSRSELLSKWARVK